MEEVHETKYKHILLRDKIGEIGCKLLDSQQYACTVFCAIQFTYYLGLKYKIKY